MIPHQAVRTAAPAKPRNNFTQDIQESGAILIVVKDRLLPITSGSHMIECAGILDAQRTSHDVLLQQARYWRNARPDPIWSDSTFHSRSHLQPRSGIRISREEHRMNYSTLPENIRAPRNIVTFSIS
jgi:hypothetical protein